MISKSDLYASLVLALAPCQPQDETLMETHPHMWKLARTIDNWLHRYRQDDHVGTEQYARNCQRLKEIYLPLGKEIL